MKYRTALVLLAALLATPLAAQVCGPGAAYFEDIDANGAAIGAPGVYAGGWTDGGGNLEWWVGTGNTSSGGTGPLNGDHTSGAGQYYFVEGSAPNVAGDTAIIAAPPVNIAGVAAPMLDFWVNMRGPGMGTLTAEEWDGAAWVQLWTISGDQGTPWFQVTTPLVGNGAGQAQVRFVGVVGPTYQSDIAIDDITICGSVTPLYAENNPGASLDIDGVIVPSPLGPIARTSKCLGASTTLNLSSNAAVAYDLLIDIGNVQPNVLTGPGGQIINLAFTSPTFFTLNSGGPVPSLLAWPGNLSLPIVPVSLITASVQMLTLDPFLPGNFNVSQASELEVVPPVLSIPGPAGDDSALTVVFSGQPLCGPSSLQFYGTTYTEMHVSSNGRVNFGGPDSDFGPTIPEGLTDNPFVGIWADLSPQVIPGGLVISADSTSVTVDFTNVPQWAPTPIGSNTFSIVFDIVLNQVRIENMSLDPAGTANAFVGITNGNLGATDPGISILSAAGAGVTTDATSMIYEFGPLANFSGVNSITFSLNGFLNYDWSVL